MNPGGVERCHQRRTSQPNPTPEGHDEMKRKSKIPAEWGEGAVFTMVDTAQFRRMSNAPYFDLYLRLWFFAAANAGANGHVPLSRNDLRYALGDDIDGARVPVRSDSVTNAIRAAKAKGLLEPTSTALCLSPSRRITSQGKGDQDAACSRCDKGRKPAAPHLRRVV